jgi:hypothetical protein
MGNTLFREKEKELLCLGDSHTVGQHGAEWVDMLAARLNIRTSSRDCVNGCETFNLLARLPSNFTATTRDHDVHVTLLIGTNDLLRDVMYSIDPDSYWIMEVYNMQNTLDAFVDGGIEDYVPGLETYRSNYNAIMDRLLAEKCVKSISCISLPPIGEGVRVEVDDTIYSSRWLGYNSIIKDIVDQRNSSNTTGKSPIIRYVPFGEKLMMQLKLMSEKQSKEGKEVGTAGVTYTFTHFDFKGNAGRSEMPPACLQVMFNKGTPIEIGDRIGRYYVHDHIHFNERAREVLIEELCKSMMDALS